MDIRAFGSVYGQTAVLPYASGVSVTFDGNHIPSPSGFAACRGLFVEKRSTGEGYLTVQFSDGQSQWITLNELTGNTVLPFSINAIASGTLESCVVLF